MRLFKRTMAAAIALAALPSTAHAADYLTYTFDVSGYATRDVQASAGTSYHREGFLTSTIRFVVPVGQFGSFASAKFLGPSYAADAIAGSLSATGLDVTEATLPYLKGPSRFFAIDACGSFGGLSGSFSVAVDPLCSSVSFFRGQPTGPGLAGDGASFKGTVTGLTVAEGFGAAPAYGLTDAPVLPVPEPATWAMTILGMGAVGWAMRRGRASTRVSFA